MLYVKVKQLTGQALRQQQMLTGITLLGIESELEIKLRHIYLGLQDQLPK